MLKSLLLITQYEIKINFRQAFNWITPLIFFIITLSLFAMVLGTDNQLLHSTAPAIIWIAILLSLMISLDGMFKSDIYEGTLDLWLQSSIPLSLLVICKALSHWLTYCLPMILMCPIFSLLLNLDVQQQYNLFISFMLGTPTLVLIGTVGAALVNGIRGHGLMLPLIIMPLYIPVLIFGVGSITTASNTSSFAILGALLLFTLAFAPFLASASLRIGVNQ